VAAGLAILTIGPVIALGGRSHVRVATVPSHSASAPTTAQPAAPAVLTAARSTMARDPELASEVTPAPTPVPTPPPPVVTPRAAPVAPPAPPPPPGSIEAIIRAAAARWNVSGDWMVKIARCESGLNPRAYNPAGPYYGLFQFLASTFRGNGGTDIWDAAQQADITAKMLAHGQAWQWGCR
jgi:soluble lytic murein transglycosylase-like protein